MATPKVEPQILLNWINFSTRCSFRKKSDDEVRWATLNTMAIVRETRWVGRRVSEDDGVREETAKLISIIERGWQTQNEKDIKNRKLYCNCLLACVLAKIYVYLHAILYVFMHAFMYCMHLCLYLCVHDACSISLTVFELSRTSNPSLVKSSVA